MLQMLEVLHEKQAVQHSNGGRDFRTGRNPDLRAPRRHELRHEEDNLSHWNGDGF
jgi:hypothetical protein